MKRILILLLPILLAGCSATSYHWQHPELTAPQALKAAEQHCALLADDELDSYGYPGPYPYLGPAYGPLAYRHFHHFPYYGGYPGEFTYSGTSVFAEAQLFRVCMKAKGWQLVPDTPPGGAQG